MSGPERRRELCVASLNIWNRNGPDFRREVALPNCLRACDADVILLQEVRLSADHKPQSVELSRTLQFPTERYFYSGDWRGEEEGLAILSKFPAVKEYRHTLPMGSDHMGRTICGLTLETPGGPVDVFNTHFAFPIDASADREKQANACIAFLLQVNSSLNQRPLVLAGDLNDVPDSPAVKRLVSTGFLADAMASTPSGNRITFAEDNPYTITELHPGRCIDYVFHNSRLNLIASRLEGRADSPRDIASDHYAVVARFALR